MDDALRATAVRAVETAGARALKAFRAPSGSAARLDGDYSETDVKTTLDEVCEACAIDIIRDAFPNDAVRSEETGRVGPGHADREWILDPLDGTNNVAAGLPTFASAVAVRDEAGTRLAAVHEPLPQDTYVAERGAGVTVDGVSVASGSGLPLAQGTVSLVVGLPAIRNPELREHAEACRVALAEASKRVLSTWAPCVDWGLLARGSIEAVVAFHPDVWERHAGTLLARESDAAIVEFGDVVVHAATDALAADLHRVLPGN